MAKLPKKTPKKIPMASNRLKMLNASAAPPALYFCAVSNNTMAMASLSIDSPKMTV